MSDRSALTRRQLLRAGAGTLGTAAFGSVLAGCAQAPGSGKIPLDFWHLLSGGDGIKMANLVDSVNTASDVYEVKPTVLAWGAPYYTKLAMASAGGRAPDVAIMHSSRIPGYAPGGLLDPWDLDVLSELGVSEQTFPAPVWGKGFGDGELFAIALDAHPFILMYNTDICEQAGVLDGDGQLIEITSPEQFLEVGRELAAVTGGHGLSYGYLGDGSQMWRLWYTMYRQQGAEFLLTGPTVEYDHDAAVTSLEFMQSLLDDTVTAASSDYGNAIAEFAGGNSGMFLSGVWELPTMQAAGIGLNAQPVPTLFGTPAAYGDSHSFVLPHQDKPDPEARRATYQFVSALLHSSFAWAQAGHIPAFLPVTESAEYGELLPQAKYAAAADILNYDPPAWFSGAGSSFQEYFSEFVQGVLLSGDDPSTAMESFIGRVNGLLEMQNPVEG